jgi:hypothetical protein
VIEAEKATYPIKRMCELLEVSRSGFYAWRKSRDGGPTPAARRRAELDAKVAKFHAASDGVYGAPRILADLRGDGERVSRGGSRRPPRWSIWMLRYPKTWWGAVSTPGCSTACGPAISPICVLVRAGCICARCAYAPLLVFYREPAGRDRLPAGPGLLAAFRQAVRIVKAIDFASTLIRLKRRRILVTRFVYRPARAIGGRAIVGGKICATLGSRGSASMRRKTCQRIGPAVESAAR